MIVIVSFLVGEPKLNIWLCVVCGGVYPGSFLYDKYWGFWDLFDVNLFENIINLFIAEQVIEVDQLEEQNNGSYWGRPTRRHK